MLHDNSSYRYSDDAQVIATISHELAHIWFGNLVCAHFTHFKHFLRKCGQLFQVTCRRWSNIYLNEAFASHFGYHGGHTVAPEAKIDQEEFEYTFPPTKLFR